MQKYTKNGGKRQQTGDVAIPDELLTALPSRSESMHLFPTLRGKQGLGTRPIRNLVQAVFDGAIAKLRAISKIDESLAVYCNDTDRLARHQSAQTKRLKPETT